MNRHGTARVELPTDREIVPGERIVATEVFEGYPDAEAVNTLVLHEDGGVTTLTVTVLHATKENRDGHVASGMEPGMQQALNRLEDLLTAGLDRPVPAREAVA